MADIKIPRFNKAMLSGRIANDIELRYTTKGTAVVKFTLAVDKDYKDSNGQWQKNTSFLDIVCWEKWAEAVNNNAHKGSPVIVEGEISARTYVDKDNNNRKAVEITAQYIQFLEYKPKDDGNTEAPPLSEPFPQPQTTNDDVPF